MESLSTESKNRIVYQGREFWLNIDGERMRGTRNPVALFFLWCEIHGIEITERNKWAALKACLKDRPDPGQPESYSTG